MSITINGYVAFRCNACNTKRSIKGRALEFVQDTSAQAKKDDYIRYLTSVESKCVTCKNLQQLKIDVWEHPAAITNYAYYEEQGLKQLSCEFTIEHYFNDESFIHESASWGATSSIEAETEDKLNGSDIDFDEEDTFSNADNFERHEDHFND